MRDFPVGHQEPRFVFTGESQFQTWLFRIAANKAAITASAGTRQTWRRPKHHFINAETRRLIRCSTFPAPPPAGPHPDAAEQVGLVQEALDQLDQPCREIVELRYFGD